MWVGHLSDDKRNHASNGRASGFPRVTQPGRGSRARTPSRPLDSKPSALSLRTWMAGWIGEGRSSRDSCPEDEEFSTSRMRQIALSFCRMELLAEKDREEEGPVSTWVVTHGSWFSSQTPSDYELPQSGPLKTVGRDFQKEFGSMPGNWPREPRVKDAYRRPEVGAGEPRQSSSSGSGSTPRKRIYRHWGAGGGVEQSQGEMVLCGRGAPGHQGVEVMVSLCILS